MSSVLDTFYILFKTNADDVIRGMNAINKGTKETEKDLKSTNEAAEKLGQSFSKIVEKATAVAGAYFGTKAVLAQIDYNKQLFVTSDLLSQNAGKMKAFSQMAVMSGGDRASSLADMASFAAVAQMTNRKYDPGEQLEAARARFKTMGGPGWKEGDGINPAQRQVLDMYSDLGFQRLVKMNDQEFALKKASIDSLTKLSNEQAELSAKFESSTTALEGAAGALVTSMTESFLPTVTGFLDSITKVIGMVNWRTTLKDNPVLPSTDANDPLAPYRKKGIFAPGRSSIGSGDMEFWKAQGYTTEQAAGIIANMVAESGGDPNVIGDNGKAKGLFQWHKPRRDAILKATGTDVWNSSKQDQLNAAAWEMKNGNTGFDDKAYRSLDDAGSAGGYFSRKYEVAFGKYGPQAESFIRGKSALSIASGYQAPVTVGNASVTISAININAPGADAKQIAQHIKDATQGALSTVQAQVDNGRKN